jgi:hypothetical protein
MKRTLFLIAAGFCCICASAQDAILKKDGSEIQAKVLEITDTQIKYKDFDFQEGPTRNINISEVFMITYHNGTKEVFNTVTTPSIETETETVNPPSNDLKSEFDRIGSNDVQMLEFFNRPNYSNYYQDFKAACNLSKSGDILITTGSCLIGGGLGFILGNLIWASETNYYFSIAGGVFIGIGNLLIIPGIPLMAVGGSRKRHIKNDFEREYFSADGYSYHQKPVPTLNFGVTQKGLGFTLNF